MKEICLVILTDILLSAEAPRTILTWDYLCKKFPWGLVLLMGSGFAMAEACKVKSRVRMLILSISGFINRVSGVLRSLDSPLGWAGR